MAANLRLIADASEGLPHEVPAGRSGDRSGQGGLAHSRWTHETQNGTLLSVHEAAHCQMLQDAILDLFEPEVIFVEHRLGSLDVEALGRVLEPRQGQHPVDVVPDHRGLGRHRTHHLELAQLSGQALHRLL